MAFFTDTFCEDGSLHLVGGDDVSRGRVVYCYEGTWYFFYADGWDEQENEARALCRSLGYCFGTLVLPCIKMLYSPLVYMQ